VDEDSFQYVLVSAYLRSSQTAGSIHMRKRSLASFSAQALQRLSVLPLIPSTIRVHGPASA
jgi:hypothetical protein